MALRPEDLAISVPGLTAQEIAIMGSQIAFVENDAIIQLGAVGSALDTLPISDKQKLTS